MFPTLGNAERYKRCLRHFYWAIEPALGAGLNLDLTKFSNIKLRKIQDPDFADIVYEVFRCAHAHGDEVPSEFEVIFGNEHSRTWMMGDGVLQLPHTLLFALLFVAVFAPVNKGERDLPGAFLTLGAGDTKNEFLISDSWGKSAMLEPIAARHNPVRVHAIFPPGHEFVADGPVGHVVIDLTPKPETNE